MKEIIKHFHIWLMLVRINFMSQMEYRANFVSGILMEAGYLIGKILYVIVAYRSGREIMGFGPDEILVFVGGFVVLTGAYAGLLATNLFQLSSLVRDGSFDMLLVKPINVQFYATLRRVEVGALIFDTLAGVVMVLIGLVRLGTGLNIVIIFGWSLFIASGAAVGYALWSAPMALVFRIVRADAIAGLADSFWDFNNVPMVVYNRLGQTIGLFVIPIFVVTNFPALFALGRMTPFLYVWAIAAPFICCFITSLLWKAGLRRYESGGN